jgi:hypothetical protein
MWSVGLAVAAAFTGGVLLGTHLPPVAAQAQGEPIQEYRLPNGVLCYTLTAAPGSFSCVAGQGLSPAGAR